MNVSENVHWDKCLLSGDPVHPLKGYERHHLVTSKSTGFVFCSKIPSQTELVNHYNQYKRNDYLSPVTVKRFNELLNEFEIYRKYNRILDIGCGIGLFLEEAKKRQWEVYGTEYTDEAVKICAGKGITMHRGKLNTHNYATGSFDVVVSMEVLEHINNPVEEMNNINRLLRPGGLFYFTTPNFNSLERFILKDKHPVIEYPEHLCYYTASTVDYLLKKTGFKKEKLLTTGLSFSTFYNKAKGAEYRIAETSGDEKLRVQLEKNIFSRLLKKTSNSILNMLKAGNSLKGYYIKH